MKEPITLLQLAAVAGAGIAWWCMSSGVGVSSDSVIYLSAADSLAAGDGLKPIAFHFTPNVPAGEPLVSFPPAYPLLLSLAGFMIFRQLIEIWQPAIRRPAIPTCRDTDFTPKLHRYRASVDHPRLRVCAIIQTSPGLTNLMSKRLPNPTCTDQTFLPS